MCTNAGVAIMLAIEHTPGAGTYPHRVVMIQPNPLSFTLKRVSMQGALSDSAFFTCSALNACILQRVRSTAEMFLEPRDENPPPRVGDRRLHSRIRAGMGVIGDFRGRVRMGTPIARATRRFDGVHQRGEATLTEATGVRSQCRAMTFIECGRRTAHVRNCIAMSRAHAAPAQRMWLVYATARARRPFALRKRPIAA